MFYYGIVIITNIFHVICKMLSAWTCPESTVY